MFLTELSRTAPKLMGTSVLVGVIILSTAVAYRIIKSKNEDISLSRDGLKFMQAQQSNDTNNANNKVITNTEKKQIN